MDLRLHLMVRIVLTSVLCLAGAALAVLWQTDRALREKSEIAAENVGRLVELHLIERNIGFLRTSPASSFAEVLDASQRAGQCIRYLSPSGELMESSCHGWEPSNSAVPAWFSTLFATVFGADREVTRAVQFRGRPRGAVVVSPDMQHEAAEAWRRIGPMVGLSATTMLGLCVLCYFVIGRALRPARDILNGLDRLASGDLDARLPTVQLIELGRISSGVNALAAHLQLNVAAREALTHKLVRVQEEERRSLAHELHDEFGQCLAALNAMTAVVVETASAQCPELVPQGKRIDDVVRRMMEVLKSMLLRLRPPGIDELGLVECLKALVSGWSGGSGGRLRFDLEITGEVGALPEPINVSIYRIVQECLTNVSKHAEADRVAIKVQRIVHGNGAARGDQIDIIVEDDGKIAGEAFAAAPGIGLIGMRERIAALGGELTLKPRPDKGLRVRALIPVPHTA